MTSGCSPVTLPLLSGIPGPVESVPSSSSGSSFRSGAARGPAGLTLKACLCRRGWRGAPVALPALPEGQERFSSSRPRPGSPGEGRLRPGVPRKGSPSRRLAVGGPPVGPSGHRHWASLSWGDPGLIQVGSGPPWAAFCPWGGPRTSCHCAVLGSPGPRPDRPARPPSRALFLEFMLFSGLVIVVLTLLASR